MENITITKADVAHVIKIASFIFIKGIATSVCAIRC